MGETTKNIDLRSIEPFKPVNLGSNIDVVRVTGGWIFNQYFNCPSYQQGENVDHTRVTSVFVPYGRAQISECLLVNKATADKKL